MRKVKKISAFSLIELSIVVLIIGILVAGVTQATSLVRKMRLQTAKSLTASSPVHGITDLALWLETSSDEGLSSDQTNDGSPVYRWKSIGNQQTSPQYYAIKNSAANVTYKELSPIGSLPSIYFSGATSTNSYFTVSTSTSSSGNTYIPTPNCNFSFF